MVFKAAILLILTIQTTTGNSPATADGPNWNYPELNTAISADYLSSLEKEIILEINMLRSNPPKYATDHLEPLKKLYRQKILYYPDDKPLRTHEGVKALNECISELKKHPSLPLVFPSEGLTSAAQDHVKDQSVTGNTGHTGSDSSGFRERMERYGKWEIKIAENIAYGGNKARQIIIYLLIDDGVSSRGHRKNFLNPDLKTAGVATGAHPLFGTITVIDLAGSFITKSP